MPTKKIVIDISFFGKLSRTIKIFMATTSYNKLNFFNLVTMATQNIVLNLFDANKEGGNRNIVFWYII